MKRTISLERGRLIIDDMLAARLTLSELAAKHKVDVVDLARWATSEQNRRWLAGLCDLANFQTQLMISQYRASAASRLLELANGAAPADGDGDEKKGEKIEPDLIRKACIDLLRLTVRRAEPAARAEQQEERVALVEMKEMLYGDLPQRGEGDGEKREPDSPPS